MGMGNSEITNNDLTRVDRQSLCIDVLCEGFINSYIEFFYLSHPYSESNELQGCSLSEDELIYLKENLVMAELSHRKADYIKTHKAYKNIADFFKQNGEFETAIYFYNKCKDICEDAKAMNSSTSGASAADHNAEVAETAAMADHLDQIGVDEESLQDIQLCTYLDLGLTYESLKEIKNAIRYHEMYLELCTVLARETDIKFANRNLIRTFKLQSDELVEQGKFEEAIAVLEKCICAGQSAHDLAGEAIAHKTLGDILFRLDKFQKATTHYKKYLKICLEIDDKKGEGAGYLSLGKSYQQIGDHVLATKYFESYMAVASSHNELQSEAEAALALGDIYCHNNNEQEKAIKYYTKNFELSRKLNLKQQVNDARIKLGIAKSMRQVDSYLKCLVEAEQSPKALSKLLDWKNKRESVEPEESKAEK